MKISNPYHNSIGLKNIIIIIVFFGCFSFSGYGQIVTTKKQEEKTEQYKKNKKKSSVSVATSGRTSAEEKKNSFLDQLNFDEEASSDYIPENIESYLALQITYNAMDFLGVRYRGGGTTRDGMDCSGLVFSVWNIFDLKLPRSSHEMATVGEKVNKDDAKIGDLIFFKTTSRSRISHVGIITEILEDDIKFIHSSTQLGVIISSLSEAYYKKTFAQINRVLN